MHQPVRNLPDLPTTRLCLTLDIDRRTPEGRIRSDREFREHFFPYDASSATDRIFKMMPREVRGPIISGWGIRGKRTAMRDDDERVTGTVHDALLSDDIDDTSFEQGLLPEILVSWCDLRDWWAFWRQGVHTKHSIGLALRTAYDLELFDARWFLDSIENGRARGTDVLVEGLAKADLGRWLRRVHESGDGSPKGLLAALGWTTLVDHTSDPVLLRVIDGFALANGLMDEPTDHGVDELMSNAMHAASPANGSHGPSSDGDAAEPVSGPASVPRAEPSSVRPRQAEPLRGVASVRKPTPTNTKTKLG
jgi:hypothetical protein